jgi:flagellar basal-body rod modification protein FlgD
METAAVSSVGNPATAGAASSGLAGINGTDFLEILIKQLQFQDPFEPVKNEEMVAQMATIRELEMNTRLSDRLEQVTSQQRFASAAALIGKYARGEVSDAEGNTFPMEGIITSVKFTGRGEALLELDTGEVLPLSGLTEVTTADGTELSAQTKSILAGKKVA